MNRFIGCHNKHGATVVNQTIFKRHAGVASTASVKKVRRFQPGNPGQLNLENRLVLSAAVSQLPAHKMIRSQSATGVQSSIAVIVKDLNEAFYRVSDSFASGLGTTPDQIVGKTDYDFYPPEMAAKYQADDRMVIESRRTWKIVEQNLIDGVPETVTVIKTPIFLGFGPGAGLPVGIKIVSRVDKNQSAQPSEQPISPPSPIPLAPPRWVILNPPVHPGQAILNASVKDGNEVIYRVNQNLANGIQMTPAQLAGKTDYDLYPADLAAKYQANDRMVIASRQKWRFVEHNIQDNKLVEVSVIKTPLFKKQGIGYGLSGGIKVVFTVTNIQNPSDSQQPISLAFPVAPATIPAIG
ncbi:MAG: PAS domain-containing protein [Planctomycetota bacterium]|nr:PAS domain-containing protein [Planctomycetota bacterium]